MTTILKPSADFLTSNKLLKVRREGQCGFAVGKLKKLQTSWPDRFHPLSAFGDSTSSKWVTELALQYQLCCLCLCSKDSHKVLLHSECHSHIQTRGGHWVRDYKGKCPQVGVSWEERPCMRSRGACGWLCHAERKHPVSQWDGAVYCWTCGSRCISALPLGFDHSSRGSAVFSGHTCFLSVTLLRE